MHAPWLSQSRPGAHCESVVQLGSQVSPPQAKAPHARVAPAMQLPSPSQVDTSIATPSAQEASKQTWVLSG